MREGRQLKHVAKNVVCGNSMGDVHSESVKTTLVLESREIGESRCWLGVTKEMQCWDHQLFNWGG